MLTRSSGSGRAARFVLPVLLAALLAACTSGAPATPRPSGSPGPSETPPPSQAVGHSTDPHVVILRAEQAGGHVRADFLVTGTPQFTLYGDGTAIYQVPPDPNAGGIAAGPLPLAVAKLDAEQVDALLDFALTAGGLETARNEYLNPVAADAPDTTFVIATDVVTKTVDIQALSSIAEGPADPDAPQLAKMARLYELLADFRTQVARGNASDAGVYEPGAYRAILIEGRQIGEGFDWPWADLTIDDFKADQEFGLRRAVLTPDQAKKLSDAPRGGLFAVGVFAPDRTPYSIALRPLLPDEKS